MQTGRRVLVVRVLIGMVDEGDVAVGALDLGGGGVHAQAQRLEVVRLAPGEFPRELHAGDCREEQDGQRDARRTPGPVAVDARRL